MKSLVSTLCHLFGSGAKTNNRKPATISYPAPSHSNPGTRSQEQRERNKRSKQKTRNRRKKRGF